MELNIAILNTPQSPYVRK